MSGWMRAAGFLDNLFAGMNCDCQRGEGAVELTEETKKDGTTKRGVLATRSTPAPRPCFLLPWSSARCLTCAKRPGTYGATGMKGKTTCVLR